MIKEINDRRSIRKFKQDSVPRAYMEAHHFPV